MTVFLFCKDLYMPLTSWSTFSKTTLLSIANFARNFYAYSPKFHVFVPSIKGGYVNVYIFIFGLVISLSYNSRETETG